MHSEGVYIVRYCSNTSIFKEVRDNKHVAAAAAVVVVAVVVAVVVVAVAAPYENRRGFWGVLKLSR